MQIPHLSTKHAHTLHQIFVHPTSRTLEWHDVVELMKRLGTVEEEPNGHLRVTVNGISLVLHRPPEKEISDPQEILDIRHFLERAGEGKGGATTAEKTDASAPVRMLVAISQKEALVFRHLEKGSVPERFQPKDPRDMLPFLTRIEGRDRAAHTPANLAYFEEVAAALAGGGKVLLMGHGTGGSNAMTHLEDFLATHHPEIGQEIVGTLVLDLEALTEDQLLEEARAFFDALQ